MANLTQAEIDAMSKEELMEAFEAAFGKKPSPKSRPKYLKTKLQTLITETDEKVESEEVEQSEGESQESKQDEVPKKVEEKAVEIPELPEDDTVFMFNGEPHQFKQGKLHAVIFRGSVRYFTMESINVIQRDPKLYEDFQLPAGSKVQLEEKKRRA